MWATVFGAIALALLAERVYSRWCWRPFSVEREDPGRTGGKGATAPPGSLSERCSADVPEPLGWEGTD